MPVGRYGSDEFILILPDASTQVTLQRAEQIVKRARWTSLQLDGHSISAVALSLGVAVFPKHGETSTAVLKAPDLMRYCAKHAGRNRVCMAEKDYLSPPPSGGDINSPDAGCIRGVCAVS